MNHHRAPSSTRETGFVLVTSLVFLVVLTLLAVSAINSSTLQERMASNQREKSRALQAANAGLEHAESLLAHPVFLRCFWLLKPPTESSTQNCDSSAGMLAVSGVTIAERYTGSGSESDATDFLADSAWTAANAMPHELPQGENSAMDIVYRVEYLPRTSNPPARLMFRVTARARGRSPSARAVTQSFYQIDA